MTRREWMAGWPVAVALFAQGKESMANASAASAEIAVSAQRSFGLQLLRDMAARTPRENIFVSPLSVFLALQMAENGASGATRTAMRKSLALPDLDAQALNGATARLVAELKERNPDALDLANALWADRRFTLAPEYVQLCAGTFGARAETLDFHEPRAAAEINDWVKAATHGKIADIVSADALSHAAVVLTNAVYFAAAWRTPFPESGTQTAAFHLTGGGTQSVPMMHHARLKAEFGEGSNFEGARLSYKQSGIFLYALLPKEGKTTGDVLGALDPARLASGTTECDLDLKLPRFNLDFSASLGGYLEKMGMQDAFHYPPADFSGMGSGRFFISDVLHKTRLEVDEKGTVAAAATAVTMTAAAAIRRPRRTLVFDRPFVLLIGESQTGALLFAGTIEKP